jgi:DNA polymerase I
MNTLIIMDANYICHVAKHSIKDLSYDEMEVGIIFGFLRQILSLSKKFKTDKFVFVWDSRYSKRKEVYPEYKNNRHKELTEEEKKINKIAYNQFNIICNEVLPQIGFRANFKYNGYEGDDLIASILKYNFYQENIIVSSDNDLYQLLESGKRIVSLYSITKKEIYTLNNLYEEWGISPFLWNKVKAISGCKSDNVIGIKGVGEKTAIKYLKGLLKLNSNTYLNIKKSLDIFNRNLPLVTLPYEEAPYIIIDGLVDHPLYLEGFLTICQQYDFKSLLTKESISQWRTNLKLK